MIFIETTKRWTEDDIIHIETDIGISAAYVYTDDAALIGTMGWHGPKQICVEYVARPKEMK